MIEYTEIPANSLSKFVMHVKICFVNIVFIAVIININDNNNNKNWLMFNNVCNSYFDPLFI